MEPNGKLDLAAQNHVEWMTRNGLSHYQGFWGPNLEKRLDNAGFDWTACAENISFGQETVERAVKKWMESPEHRNNILGSYQFVSIYSAASPSDTPYWIAVFASGR